MPRPRVSDEQKKETRRRKNAKYYEKYKERILEKNGDIAKLYYQNHKDEISIKNAVMYKKRTQDLKDYKEFFDELSNLDKTS